MLNKKRVATGAKFMLTAAFPSQMTVREWVSTPWHYHFLTYQPMKAAFHDGETYSMGCKRCSRPFYEYQFLYAPMRGATEPTCMSFPFSLWEAEGSTTPVPFHDEGVLKVAAWPLVKAGKDGLQLASHSKGTDGVADEGVPTKMNWPTFLLKDVGKTKARLEILNTKRKAANKNKIERKRLHYRQYLNHLWKDGVWSGKEWGNVAHGRLMHGSARLQFGMRGVRVTRASRYSNVCTDCAAVLEHAPGLYLRNYRQAPETGVIRKKAKESDAERISWWTQRLMVPTANRTRNPVLELLHKKNRTDEETRDVDDMLAGAGQVLQEYHNVSEERSKHTAPPDVFIQTHIRKQSVATEKTQLALDDLGRLMDAYESKPRIHKRGDLSGDGDAGVAMDVPRPNPPDLTMIDFSNPALRDMIAEVQHKYMNIVNIDRTQPVFDTDQLRIETRSVSKKWGAHTWNHSLHVRTWRPVYGVEVKDKITGRSLGLSEADYEEVWYLATMGGESNERLRQGGSIIKRPAYKDRRGMRKERVTEDYGERTMWKGDKFVNIEDGGVWTINTSRDAPGVKQVRRLTQSNLFVTYSLHRPVTSEAEGRYNMERMADAAKAVFGSDRLLAYILRFGVKLGENKEGADTVSTHGWQVIQSASQKMAVAEFYGSGEITSYLDDTYETHVESVTIDGGIEIGPIRKHPHFHILLSLKHWSYVQVDYFRMNAVFELMFKGKDPFEWFRFGSTETPDVYMQKYTLRDASGGFFYGDNESPWVDVTLYPQDNWQSVLAAYVRKGTVPGVIESLNARAGTIEYAK